MKLRLRLSLLARMVVAAGILLSIPLVVALFLTVFGGMVLLGLLGWSREFLVVLADLPRLSSVTALSPVVVAGATSLTVGVVVGGWPYLRSWTNVECLLPPDTPLAAGIVGGLLGCLYLVVVEASAAAVAALSSVTGMVVLFFGGAGVAVRATVREVRKRIRHLQDRIVGDSSLLEHTEPAVAATARRLARLADVPEPTVRVTGSERPESVTIGSGEDALVLVSAGLVEILSGAELEAVLAHEIAHLANGDSRVMSAALGPVLAADEYVDDDPTDLGDRVWNLVFGGLKRYGQFGVAFLSRGRERAADVAAAELTGSPAALASAIGTLTDARDRPDTDLREWEQSVPSWTSSRRRTPTSRRDRSGPTRPPGTGSSTCARWKRQRNQRSECELLNRIPR